MATVHLIVLPILLLKLNNRFVHELNMILSYIKVPNAY